MYQWFCENIPNVPSKPVQHEFARLNLEGAVTSKRKLLKLVNEGKVTAWDDPRLLTICGLRRRGCRPWGIKKFCDGIGVTTSDSMQAMDLLDDGIREDLKTVSVNRMVVVDPLKVVITDLAADFTSTVETGVLNHPDAAVATERFGSVDRPVAFSNELYLGFLDIFSMLSSVWGIWRHI